MKTFLDIGYSSGIFWRCVGDPTETPGRTKCRAAAAMIQAAVRGLRMAPRSLENAQKLGWLSPYVF
jgi:hypothetical protein